MDRASFEDTPLKVGPSATLATTDFHGSSASVWNMKLTPFGIPSTGLPETRTIPALGRSRPAAIVNVVDLPQPVGPTIAQNWPGSTVRSTSRNAVIATPAGDTNRLGTPLKSTPTPEMFSILYPIALIAMKVARHLGVR